MPQLILEYSDNIIEKNDLKTLLLEFNELLASKLPAQLVACKSRAIEHTIYCVADGSPQRGFIHVNLQIMAGRTVERLNEVAQLILNLLKQYFAQSAARLKLEISLEIRELANTYYKIEGL